MPGMGTEHSSDERWVTHREAAELWGITVDSARLKLGRYAREKGWRSRKSNRGKLSYLVPEGYEFSHRASVEQPPEPTPEPPAVSPEQPPDQSKEISRLSEAVAILAEQLARAQAELDAERSKGLWTRAKEAWRGR